MLSFDAIVVSIVLIFIVLSFYKEWIGPAFTFLIGVVALGIFGILTPSEIMAGFANDQVMVILMLLLIGDIIRDLGIVENLFDKVFQKAKIRKPCQPQMWDLRFRKKSSLRCRTLKQCGNGDAVRF